MKPNFALNLSHEGISLLHRAKAGWTRVGDVALDDADLTEQLQMLRKTAADLESGGLTSKLVIPNSQILYTEIETPGPDTAARIAQIRDGLVGLTPYDVKDLVFDWRLLGSRAQVAVVARETLHEAEAFAAEYRFNPVSFVAVPVNGGFEGEPFFGLTRHAETLLPHDETVERDDEPITILGPGRTRKRRPKPETPAEPAAASGPSDAADEPMPTLVLKPDPGPAPEPDTVPEPAPAEPVAAGPAAAATFRAHRTEPPTAHGNAPAPAAKPKKPKAPARRKAAKSGKPAAGDGKGAPVAFASRRATERPEPPPPAAVPPSAASGGSGSAPVAPPPPKAKPAAAPEARFSQAGSALDLDDLPDMPAWRTVNGRGVTPLSVTAAHTADMPDAGAGGRDKAKAAGAALAGTIGKLGKGTASGVRRMRQRQDNVTASNREAEAMTVFGARGHPSVGGKPRYLGLVLTLLLLLALGVLALWSSLFLGENGAGLFGRDEDAPQIAAIDPTQPLPEPTQPLPEPPAEDLADPAPGDAADPAVGAAPDAGPLPGAIDAAVETALQDAPGAGAAPDAPADPGVDRGIGTTPAPEPAADATPEPTQETEPGETTDLALLQDPVAPVASESPPPDRVVQPPPTRAEAEASYAATGIWQLDPDPLPEATGGDRLEDVYVASIDPAISAQDPGAIPGAAALLNDLRPTALTPPPGLGTRFDLDERGLVRATPEGALNPDGVRIFAGTPPVVPRLRPGSAAPAALQPETETDTGAEPAADPEPEPEPALDPERERLRNIRPPARPDTLQETRERTPLDESLRSELAQIRPTLRPPSIQEQAATETAETTSTVEGTATAEEESATDLAVIASLTPLGRPAGFSETVQRALEEAAAAEPEPEPETKNTKPERAVAAAVVPSIPTRASVAKQATERNAINLGKVNLIGVYGSPTDRRALVRLKSGRYVKVEVGDRVDGGRVAAIGDDELQYVKGGRNITLRLPRG